MDMALARRLLFDRLELVLWFEFKLFLQLFYVKFLSVLRRATATGRADSVRSA